MQQRGTRKGSPKVRSEGDWLDTIDKKNTNIPFQRSLSTIDACYDASDMSNQTVGPIDAFKEKLMGAVQHLKEWKGKISRVKRCRSA